MSVDADHPGLEVPPDEATDRTRLERAADELGVDGPEAFVQEATQRLLQEVLDEDGELECPHDDCSATFATIRERRGHLGSSEHALDVPEGDFWCGYCGFGPRTWRGINAHHGSSDHDGDPVRLEEEPDREDLLAPEDVPDHKNPDLLADLYRRHDGNYTEMCREHDFDVTPGRVRHYLIEFGIHEVTPQGPAENGDGPVYRDREWLQERYDEADGNISEMHRRIEEEEDVDVPYRTLLKNLKSLGIHDPTESPGRSQTGDRRGPDSEASDVDEDEDVGTTERASPTEDADEAEPEPDEADPPEPDEDLDVGGTDPVREVAGGDDPDEVNEFGDLETPAWLDEDSFYVAADMAADVDELADTLGWPEHDRLEAMVVLLDVDDIDTRGEVAV